MKFERTKPLVSVIIPSWFENGMNGRHGINETYCLASKCLKRFLEVIPREKIEIIIIDNGSTLTTNDVPSELPVEWYWGQADILVRNPENLGFAPAINQGVNLARGEYILFLNNDIYIWDNFLDDLIEVFQHTDLGCPVGVAMPNLIKKEVQKGCVNERGKLDVEKVMALKKEEILFPSKERYEMGAEFGSAFLMKKELVDKIKEINGGYEFMLETFLCGFSEDRWVWHQVRKLGYDTFRTNRIRCLHIGNVTISKVPNRKDFTEENRRKLAELVEQDNR